MVRRFQVNGGNISLIKRNPCNASGKVIPTMPLAVGEIVCFTSPEIIYTGHSGTKEQLLEIGQIRYVNTAAAGLSSSYDRRFFFAEASI
jgi:hypothetical protein